MIGTLWVAKKSILQCLRYLLFVSVISPLFFERLEFLSDTNNKKCFHTGKSMEALCGKKRRDLILRLFVLF